MDIAYLASKLLGPFNAKNEPPSATFARGIINKDDEVILNLSNARTPQDVLNLLGTSSVGGFTVETPVSFTTAGTTTYSESGKFRRISAAAGSGAYTRKIVLDVAGRANGDALSFLLAVAAGSSATVEVYNAAATGTPLFTYTAHATNDGLGRLDFIFDGTEWVEAAPNQVFEITASGGGGGTDPTLLAFWKLDDLTDASGNGHTLTAHGSPTFAAGKIGNAVTGNRTTDYLTSDLDLTSESAWSVSMWLKRSEITGGASLAFALGGQIAGCLNVYAGAAHATGLQIFTPDWAETTAALAEGAWANLIITQDASTVNIYLNNTLIDSKASSALTGVGVGILAGTTGFYKSDGMVDAVAIYRGVLTEAQRNTLYASGAGYEFGGGSGGGGGGEPSPGDLIVSGAGTAGVNGTYTPTDPVDGNPVWTNGDYSIYFDNGGTGPWCIITAAFNSYLYHDTVDAVNPWETTMDVTGPDSGELPAPTIAQA